MASRGWRRDSARHSLAARGVGTKPRRTASRYPSKSKTSGAITFEGKVTGISRPKEYPAYGGGYIEKFFVEVTGADGVAHKAMVYTMPNRERPFKGDTVKYTTMPEKNGWGSVTDKQDFEIVSHEGYESWRTYKQEQEARERAEQQAREEEARRRAAEETLRRQQEFQRERELERKWEKSFRRAVGDYGADLIEDAEYGNRDRFERLLKGVRDSPSGGYEGSDVYRAFVRAGLLSVRPGRLEEGDKYYLTEDGKKVLAQMEAGRL